MEDKAKLIQSLNAQIAPSLERRRELMDRLSALDARIDATRRERARAIAAGAAETSGGVHELEQERQAVHEAIQLLTADIDVQESRIATLSQAHAREVWQANARQSAADVDEARAHILDRMRTFFGEFREADKALQAALQRATTAHKAIDCGFDQVPHQVPAVSNAIVNVRTLVAQTDPRLLQ